MMSNRAILSMVLCVGGAFFLDACFDGGQSPPSRAEPPQEDTPGGAMLAPMDLVYVCGNKYLVTNSTKSPVQVQYRVAGTRETGSLMLREGPVEDPGFSETELETTNRGTVELYHDDLRVARRANEAVPCETPAMSAPAAATGPEATVGRWTAPFAWPVVAVHLHMLRTGKVLSWGKVGDPYVWDPSTKAFTAVPILDWIFCSGHTLLADGRLLVNGGHISDHHGIPDANLFDPATLQWSARAPMARGRWYPTTTTLGNGEAVTIAGRDQAGREASVPEVWTGSGWRKLSSADRVLPYYPRTFLAPNGKVFYAGEGPTSLYLSTSLKGAWSSVATRRVRLRDYGSAAMYQPGRVLYVGGGRAEASAEVIDLNQPVPAWRLTKPMANRRRQLNATILPNGEVLVTGGSRGVGFSDEGAAVFAAESWNPATETWTTLASSSVARVYHSTALLLKDGRVLVAGSGDGAGALNHYNAEIFSPPYLFKGARPRISSAPSGVGYGQTFLVSTPTPTAIKRVTWVRLGSVTHAFNSNQRFNELTFKQATGGISVTAPPSRNLAPPGHYMMFILNDKGVPSTAKIVRLR